jgi:hypothetical protein
MTGTIELTAHEKQLVDTIEFDRARYCRLEREEVIAQGTRARQLFESLLDRKTIPEARLRYFADPDYNLSNPKASKRELFLRTSKTDAAMYEHGHFALNYLGYFVFGADLPSEVKTAFEELSAEFMTGIKELTRLATTQAKRSVLEEPYRSEAFYQLALDAGREQHEAAAVRNAVKKMKRS